MVRHALTLDSDMAAVPPLCLHLRTLTAELGLSDDEALLLELCLVEALNNSIEHAYRLERGHAIEVTCEASDQVLTVTITDQGRPMRSDQIARARMPEPDRDDPSTWSERGRGLAMIKEGMDELRYTSCEGRNTLTMSKRLKRLASSQEAPSSRSGRPS